MKFRSEKYWNVRPDPVFPISPKPGSHKRNLSDQGIQTIEAAFDVNSDIYTTASVDLNYWPDADDTTAHLRSYSIEED